MRDSQHGGQGERDVSGVSSLARSVLSRLSQRFVESDRGPGPDEVEAMARTAAAIDPADFQALRAELRRRRVSEADLADLYFPAVARKLGQDWADDRLGFAEVSIGLARLQAVLHDVARDWFSNNTARPDSATTLLLLPEAEQHSFGALVLMGRLRRRGVSVQLMTGARPDQVQGLLRRRSFDVVMISLACEERVEPTRNLVAAVRRTVEEPVQIVVGGAVMERIADLKGLTGADLATCDPDLALAGLDLAPRRVHGGLI
jgi:methylmalonyl-CoA mutase cobalamin-binding subunit